MDVLLNFGAHRFQPEVQQQLRINVPHIPPGRGSHLCDDIQRNQRQLYKILGIRITERSRIPFHSNSKKEKQFDQFDKKIDEYGIQMIIPLLLP